MSREIERAHGGKINCGRRLVLGCVRGLVAWTLLQMVIVWASAVCSALFAARHLGLQSLIGAIGGYPHRCHAAAVDVPRLFHRGDVLISIT